MHTCSCGAVFEAEQPHCRSWSDLVTLDALFTAPKDGRDTHNVEGPLRPGRACRRLDAGPVFHHTNPNDGADRFAIAGQVVAAPAVEAEVAGTLWTGVVLLIGLTTLVAACLHYLG